MRKALRYVEVFVPAVVAAVVLFTFVVYLFGLAVIERDPAIRAIVYRDLPYEAGGVAFACALAAAGYFGHRFAWTGLQRAAFYFAWVLVFSVFVLAWTTRTK